jgi:hypothetical protein
MAGKSLNGDMREPAPQMFSQPTEALEPLVAVRSDPALTVLHTQWADRQAAASMTVPTWRRATRKVRRTLARLGGVVDHETTGDLIRALDVLATRVDEISGRVARHDAIAAELAGVLGQELSRLRALLESQPVSDPPEPIDNA